MTGKEYLKRIIKEEMNIETMKRTLAVLESNKFTIRALNCDDVRVQSCDFSDPTIIIDRIDALEREITAETNILDEMKRETGEKIEKIYNPQLISLLKDRYIKGLSLEKISEKNEMSYETVKKWHKQAVEIFCKENGMKL